MTDDSIIARIEQIVARERRLDPRMQQLRDWAVSSTIIAVAAIVVIVALGEVSVG